MTRSDSLHPIIYKEDKYAQRHSAVTLWRETKEKAKAEGKIPLVCLHEAGDAKSFWLVIHKDDVDKIIKERKLAKSRRNS